MPERNPSRRLAPRTPAPNRPLFRVRHARWLTLATAAVLIAAAAAKGGAGETPDGSANARWLGEMQRQALTLPPPAAGETVEEVETEAQADGETDWQTLTVESGDVLARILGQAGIGARTIHALVHTSEHGGDLADLRPGERIRLGHADGELVELVREVEDHRRIHFRRDDDGTGFTSEAVSDPLERRLAYASGEIRRSLVAAGQAEGLSTATTLALAEIFAWDVDFALDLRRGDRFHVVYERFYRDGEHVRDGAIVAAEFVNGGQRHRAVRYTDPQGDSAYFAPDGTAIRRAFLRTPIEYSRVSSGFGRRHHPVLQEMRDHNGTDYAASTGTPIRATGDGRIVKRARQGGYGRTVVLRHGERYTTLYAHMSRFAAGQAVGSRVEQGDTIGYVGSSGRSTGPHLHYEFRVDGVPRDPQTVALPRGQPVAEAYRTDFASHAGPLLAQLETLRRTQVVARR